MMLVLVIGLPVVIVAAFVLVLVTWLRGKSRTARAQLAEELAAEPALRGPESAVYRGSTGGYSNVSGNGQFALTRNRLIFRKIVGKGVDIPLRSVSGVSKAKVFNKSVRGGSEHLVVHTHTGDVGYLVVDTDAWVAAIEAAIRR
jgi:hypothetical protein